MVVQLHVPLGPDLYNSKDKEDGRLLVSQQPTVGQPEFARKYHSHAPAGCVLGYRGVLEGYTKSVVAGFTPWANSQQRGSGTVTLASC